MLRLSPYSDLNGMLMTDPEPAFPTHNGVVEMIIFILSRHAFEVMITLIAVGRKPLSGRLSNVIM